MDNKGSKGGAAVVGGSSPMVCEKEEEAVATTPMRTAETILRLLPMALCISALILMLRDSQTNDFGSLSYSDLTAFRFFFYFPPFSLPLSPV